MAAGAGWLQRDRALGSRLSTDEFASMFLYRKLTIVTVERSRWPA